jgi:hypothetical protein
MALSIIAAIARIKSDVARWLTPEAIRSECQVVGHTWRERRLDPVTTIHLFLLQILHGNTACAHVPRLGGVDCTGEAYHQARSRLPLALLRGLLDKLGAQLGECGPVAEDGRWRGHRTFLVDGSSLSMPDTPALQKEYGQPSAQAPGCGFPVMHLLALFHATTGFLISVATAPLRTHDLSRIGRVHPALHAGDLLVGDRAFCSFSHLALLQKQGVFGLFRTHQKQIVSFENGRRHASGPRRTRDEKGLPTSKWIARLGPDDQLVEYAKPKQRPSWLSEAEYADLPPTLGVREVRFTIANPGCRTRVVTLATTLVDPVAYPATALAELYGQRWQIELNFRHLKKTMGMDVLHCQTVAGVQKELAMYALVYNLIRLVMVNAATQQGVPAERISFVDAARWLAEAVHGDTPLRLRVNPHRPGRDEPRVKKRRPKSYTFMTEPRCELRKRLQIREKVA